ncbi:RiPP biosynthesis radical SAM protein ApyD [Bradyrhizobium betae]|uniref:Uncharacterized protein n=1 Tax=Bradyrhizobium betae TaxID=244734 RepID=A0A4Q1V8B6_9BRAD|nr:radical SAM protein [Bradyrhizobium betae]RXT47858.1 hypothetical protein B5V03_16515 [Bradyrhizobium betae]
MRLILVDNFVMPGSLDPDLFDVHPHLGLTSLAAVAAKDNHTVVVYDPKREVRFGHHPYDGTLYERVAVDILRLRPDAVGFTTLSCSFIFAVRVAALLKQRAPGIPILLGGPHATMLHREIMDAYGQFDIIVRHEAEETLPPLLAMLETRKFDGIPGVTWRDGRGLLKTTPGLPKVEDLDSLPIPSYELYPITTLGLDLMRVEAGRGCPFVCTFCSTSTFFQRDYRLKSAERIVHEMDLLHARYGATEFKLDHDLFTVNRRKVREFCETVQDRGYNWRVSARTDCVDADLLETMALAGCIGLYFGIETGSPRMQRLADKRLKLDGVTDILNIAENFGIETTASFITGYPEELQDDQDQTLDMLGACFGRPQDACTPQLHILLPEPGTPMFSKHSANLAYDGYVTKFNACLFQGDRSEVLAHPKLYSTYYYYPAAMPRERYVLAVDAVDALRTVGHQILNYALRFFRGRLSLLIAAFRDWLASNGALAAKPDLALEFITARFSASHHLTSLFRYGLAVSVLKQAGTALRSGDNGAPSGQQAPYARSPGSCILTELHDCGALLERISALPATAGPLSARDAGQRGCYLLVVQQRSVLYRVDPELEIILDLFETPQHLTDVMRFLHDIASDTELDDHLLDRLVDIGALVHHADQRASLNAAS